MEILYSVHKRTKPSRANSCMTPAQKWGIIQLILHQRLKKGTETKQDNDLPLCVLLGPMHAEMSDEK